MDKYQDAISKLKTKGIMFDQKLSNAEIKTIEKLYGIIFPSELKQLFSTALPVSNGFYNWRDTSKENILKIKKSLERPINGLKADLESGCFWCDEWGEKPDDTEAARSILLQQYKKAPKVIPVYSHRYIPSVGENVDSPVLSINGSDIVYYGENLISYFEIEFGFRKYSDMDHEKLKHINFWNDIM